MDMKKISKPRSNITKINATQKQALANFMEEHSDLAKGILPNCAQGKATANRLWEDLTTKLNFSGPPSKDSKSWRKVYADQKQMVKKKLSFNKSSKRRTGGGPYEEKVLTHSEEQIVEAAGLHVSVDGLKGIESFGSTPKRKEGNSKSSLECESQNKAMDDSFSYCLDLEDEEEEEPHPKKVKLSQKELPTTSKGQRETKTSLLKQNIISHEEYHTEVLKKFDKLLEIKNKSLKMKEDEHDIDMQIKSLELQIRAKELEKLNN